MLVDIIKNPIFITVLVILAGVGVIFYGVQAADDGDDDSKVEQVEHFWGDPDSEVVIVDYSDFLCGHCMDFALGTEQRLRENFEDEIKFVYRHFPLQAKSRNAAEASEAAARQGKFWEYHKILYENQGEGQSWDTGRFEDYAREVGVEDIERFVREVKDDVYEDVVEEQAEMGKEQDVDGTPTLFINGERVEDRSYEGMEKLINEKLSESE